MTWDKMAGNREKVNTGYRIYEAGMIEKEKERVLADARAPAQRGRMEMGEWLEGAGRWVEGSWVDMAGREFQVQ